MTIVRWYVVFQSCLIETDTEIDEYKWFMARLAGSEVFVSNKNVCEQIFDGVPL